VVGLATGSGKPVWVFEDYNDNIPFPIPFVTDYVRYNLGEIEHLRNIGQMLHDSLPIRKVMPPDGIRCPHANCNAVYSYWSDRINMQCPVCRQTINFKRPVSRKNPYRFDRITIA
jgi:hypothetical protein